MTVVRLRCSLPESMAFVWSPPMTALVLAALLWPWASGHKQMQQTVSYDTVAFAMASSRAPSRRRAAPYTPRPDERDLTLHRGG